MLRGTLSPEEILTDTSGVVDEVGEGDSDFMGQRFNLFSFSLISKAE